ncbi:MAG: hypothetical protein ABSE59_11700 [Opitutaceae bacterium]|jgi:hypothetical protein
MNDIDPLGLFSWWDFGGGVLNFTAGLGNAVSFGGSNWLAKQIDGTLMGADAAADIQYSQDCSGAFKAGEWASLGLGLGRLGYAGLAKGTSMFFAAAEGAPVANAMAAVSVRNGLKIAFRAGLWRSTRIYSFEQMAAKYGAAEKIIAAAGRTSPYYNGLGSLAASGGLKGLNSGYGCQKK